MKNIPAFHEWTNKQISYLYYKLETDAYIFKQISKIPQTDVCYMYIVKEGEFEQIGKVTITKEVKISFGRKLSVEK